jgi:D-alanyl-D-alanine carboxypeptidase
VASATRGGRRLITVVMGSPNAKERTLKAADLFERGFAFAGWGGQTVDELPTSSLAAPPNLRPQICGGGAPPQEDSEAVVAGTTDGNMDGAQLPAPTLAFAGVGANPDWKNQALPPRAPLQPVLVWIGRDPAESALMAEAEDAEAKPARRGRGRAKLAARPDAEAASDAAETPAAPKAAKPKIAKPKPPARPKVAGRSSADAPTLAAPASIIDDGKKKNAVNPARTLSGADKPKRAVAASQGGDKAAAKAGKPQAKPQQKREDYAADTKKPASAPAKAKTAAKTAAKSKKDDD